ncbi:thioredoxin [uncultured Brevibacillus sp.]|uniref:thioredoxin n=1 Tax=uncultured Brevibacillus sp. TaxID=169970 RepID=UPI002599A8AD|nr:thioredoxin [uncultured Brevibacillus sp.]
MICHSTDSTFTNDVRSEGLTLVNFWAPWCGPCRMFGSVLEDYDTTQREDVRIVKINVDEHEQVSSHYGVMSLPTTILFKDGKPVDKEIGYMSKVALTAWVSSNR